MDNCERILVSYFSVLFHSSSPANIQLTCKVVKGKLNDGHKDWCEGEFT